MIEVQALTAYPASVASARVRVHDHIPILSAHGVSLDFRPSFTDADYARLASSASPLRKAGTVLSGALRAGRNLRVANRSSSEHSLLFVHRLLAPVALPGIDPPRKLDVYDFDDALFVGSVSAVNARFDWLKQEARRAHATAARARLVIAANDYLASQAHAINPQVVVVPSCVDTASQPLHVHSDRESVVIGWIGSGSTVPYLRSVLPTVERLHERDPRVRLLVIGGDTGLRADWIEHRRWSLERTPQDLAEFDVGLMPLPDDPWTRGKAGYKILQYYSAGVPAIGSPVGVNAQLLADGRGIGATTEPEWEAALHELIGDAESRAQRGTQARLYVEERYSYQRWSPELARLLTDLA